MRISWRRAIVMMLWLGCGCGGSSPDDGTVLSSVGSEEGSTAAASSGATSPSTGEATTAATGEASSGGPPTTGGADSTTTEPASTGSADTGPACQPPAPEGNECLECVVANCCLIWANCQADEACACVVDCHVLQGNSLGMCSNQCNLDSDLYQGVYLCGEANCLGSCDWMCC